MGIFKRLSNLFSSSGQRDKNAYWFTVRCNRCGEQIRGRVDMRNELTISYDDNTYYSRKVLMGDKLCFQKIEVELTFDKNRRLIERKIRGGKFVDEQENQAEA
ncbi:MAG: hypothetical protein P8074_18985 [Anaerolineales bacterium]|jgi:hypothetical protein